MASFVSADVQNEKVLLQMEIPFSAYTIYVCLRRGKNSLPTFVSKVPIVQIMLLYLLAYCSFISKLIMEHTQMCTLCLCVHKMDI